MARAVVPGVVAGGELGGFPVPARVPRVPLRVLPRQAARCLVFVCEHPRSSGVEVQVGLGMRHLSQASRVLSKLEREGLVWTDRARAVAHSWRLTARGEALVAQLPGGFYD
jgi:hypothetical protein